MNKISEIINEWCIKGLKLPYAHDPTTGKPSITLLFPYLTGLLAIISVIFAHFKTDVLLTTCVSILFWSMSMIFYMLRKLNKAKIDLDDRSLELEGNQDDK